MSESSSKKNQAAKNQQPDKKLSRRGFLKGALAGTAAAALTPSTGMALSWEKFLQQHYQRLTPDDMKKVIARIERETLEKYGAKVTVKDDKPMDGVEFAYCLNLSKCIGCRKCVYGCVKENNQSRDPQIQYIKVIELEKGSFDLEKGDIYYDREAVPAKDKFYMPVACHQCKTAPCTRVCPVKATWKEPDGIVVVDYDWCIGCRYCQAACPYDARRFNWATPTISKEEINPRQGYLSNRIRPKGVMEKCHFCLHKTRHGEYPACLEVCPTGSRKFGNMLDPDSEVRRIIDNKRTYVLKEEIGTIPRFYYFFD